MSNPGIAPPDFSTHVGAFRLVTGDVNYAALNPVVAGQGDYTLFSDAEVQGYLDVSAGILSAAGYAYMALAAEAALKAKSVKDFDLSVDLTKRAAELRAQAAAFFQRAADEDAASEDAFTIVHTGNRYGYWPPELAPWDYSEGVYPYIEAPYPYWRY